MKRLFIFAIFMFIFSFSITNSIYAFGKENNLNNQEQNIENRQLKVQTEDDVDDNSIENENKEEKDDRVKNTVKGKGVVINEQRRSEVANAVHEILKVADRNEGIGEQVRVIAQSQKENHDQLEDKLEKIKHRSNFAKFFIGSKYDEIEKAKELIKKDVEKINQLEELKSKITKEEDKIKITEQIETIKKAVSEVQEIIKDEGLDFSLFGWLAKIL